MSFTRTSMTRKSSFRQTDLKERKGKEMENTQGQDATVILPSRIVLEKQIILQSLVNEYKSNSLAH